MTATLFLSSYVGEAVPDTNMGEAYEAGATDGQAVVYGLTTGAIEAGTELLAGGLGKGLKALGISRGFGGFDDIFAKKLSSKIVGAFADESVQRIVGNSVEAIVKAGGEGFEELLSGAASVVMKKLTYMNEKEWEELIKDEKLLEQFVVGAIVSSIAQAPSYISANQTGTDFVTGLTSNEEGFVNEIAKQVVAEKEASGKKVTFREKNKIYNDVIEALTQSKQKSNKVDNVSSEHQTATPDTLEQAVGDAVADGNATQIAKSMPVSNATATGGDTSTQEASAQNAPRNARSSVAPQSQGGVSQSSNDIASSYGARGKAAFEEIMAENNWTPEQTKRRFQSAYELGLTEAPRRKVRLIDAIQETAYNAGRQDGILSMKKEKTKGIAIWGKNGGLIENDYTKRLDNRTFDTLNKIG